MKRLLKWMKIAVCGKAFDSPQFGSIGLNRQHNARTHRFAVEVDSTGAAHAVFATNMCTGESKIFTQEIGQKFAWFTPPLAARAIDCESY
jgi:hypothetical protein